MRERPIIFSGDMVRAILEGRKTVTRRVVKPQPECRNVKHDCRQHVQRCHECDDLGCCDNMVLRLQGIRCPHGQAGDRLWVRETWRHFGNGSAGWDRIQAPGFEGKCWVRGQIIYRADGATESRGMWTSFELAPTERWWNTGRTPWSSPIFMPRWASRIDLEITRVGLERLHEITIDEIRNEGLDLSEIEARVDARHLAGPARCHWQGLWNEINGDRAPWADNPWVWVVGFRRLGTLSGDVRVGCDDPAAPVGDADSGRLRARSPNHER